MNKADSNSIIEENIGNEYHVGLFNSSFYGIYGSREARNYDIELPTLLKVDTELIIDKLDKLKDVINFQYEDRLDLIDQKLRYKELLLLKEEKIKNLKNVVKLSYKELEKRTSGRVFQYLSMLGLFISLLFYFITAFSGGIILTKNHFILFILFFVITFTLAFLSKNHIDVGNNRSRSKKSN